MVATEDDTPPLGSLGSYLEPLERRARVSVMARDARMERNLPEWGGPRKLRTRAQRESRRRRTASFSNAARRRYLNHVRNVQTLTHELTLTYSGRAPMDDRVVKGHLGLFKRWMDRRGVGLVWRVEFDLNGRVHFHLLLTGPVDVTAASDAWADITGCSRNPHLVVGRRIQDRTAIEYYFAKPRGHRSNFVPDGYLNMGKWWGYGGPGSRPVPLLVLEGPEAEIAPLWRAAKKAQASKLSRNPYVKRKRRRDKGAMGFRLYDGGGEGIACALSRFADKLGEDRSKATIRREGKGVLPPGETPEDGS